MRQVSRKQWIALLVTTANLALILLFPPYDYLSLQRGNVPTFAGFHWIFADNIHLVINDDFLALEVFVVLINTSIAWLVLVNKQSPPALQQFWRNGLLWMVAGNLLVMMLFPPFENYASVSKAVIPSFEGFYFIFADHSQRQLITPILYIEITLLLINTGLLLLLLKDRKS
jgi:hypothetical protein